MKYYILPFLGIVLSLSVLCQTPNTLRDIDGNVYKTVVIGNQIWMAENLKVTRYNDGTAIPNVSRDDEWAEFSTPAYCWYNNDVSNNEVYGALYNGKAVNNDNMFAVDEGKKVCPSGWHVPSRDEWKTLDSFLITNGYTYDERFKTHYAKSMASSDLWDNAIYAGSIGNSDYPSLKNKSGFSAVPGGVRAKNGNFEEIRLVSTFWSTSHLGGGNAWGMYLEANSSQVFINPYSIGNGCSVRCLRDIPAESNSGNSGNSVTNENSPANSSSHAKMDGLVAFYPFNGNAEDESGFGLNGIVHGASLTTDRFGKANSAYSFNGSSNYIDITNVASLNPSTSISLSLWVQTSNSHTNAGLIGKWNNFGGKHSDGQEQYVLIAGPKGLSFYVKTQNKTPNSVSEVSINYKDGNWNHYAGIWDGNNIALYENGILISKSPYSGNMLSFNQDLEFGRYAGGLGGNQNYFNGKLDDIRIYNRALTENEIRSLYEIRDVSASESKPMLQNQSPQTESYSELTDRKLIKKKGDYYFSDGSTFEGERKKGYANGPGKRIFADGSVYEGNFLNGYFNGHGVLEDSDGGKYVGNFESDKRNGLGIQTFSNGEKFEGSWKNNSQNGNGKYQYADGSEYKGNWLNGNREGFGTLTHKDGSAYDGNWADDRYNGNGRYRDSDGSIYEGSWKNGMKEGPGVLRSKNGGVYEGSWANNLENGQGKIRYKEGVVYEGEFKDGHRHGHGKLTWVNGNYYEGEWANDEATGKGERTYDDGEYHSGYFVSGRREGYGKTVYNDGRYYEGIWKNDLPSGQGMAVWPDGVSYEGSWKNGMKNGFGVAIVPGAIFEGEFDNNQMSGKGKITYDNGETYEGDWVSGYRHGIGKSTLPNGDVFIGEFVYNEITGHGKQIKANGETYEGEWENGTYMEPIAVAQNDPVEEDESGDMSMTEQILERLTSEEVAFFYKIAETYDTDPENKINRFCGHGYKSCEWCGKEFKYEKYYESRIKAIKLMTDPYLDTYGSLMLELGSLFTGDDIIASMASDLKQDLKLIRRKDYYYCEDSPPDYCSEKCRIEHSFYR